MRTYFFNIIGLLLITALFAHQAQAQGKLVFEKNRHNFGKIKEEDGKVKVIFEFTNTGNAAVALTSVQASCGCTTPTWTQEPVAPGKTGIITAVYDPTNRPGPFNKSITIKSNGTPSSMVLMIEGEVIPRKKGPKDWFPTENGALRMKNGNVYFNQVLHDQVATMDFLLFNQSNQPVNIKLAETRASLPAHVSLEATPTVIQPNDSLTLKFSYDATKKNDWGYTTDRFMLMTDDPKQPAKQMYLSANIVENFGNLTSESKFPIVSYDKIVHDFGKVNPSTISSVDFTMSNTGDAPLIIRKTSATCGCTASNPKKTTLQPGESTTVTVSFNSAGKKGLINQTVTIITNDPSNASTLLKIKAEVNQ